MRLARLLTAGLLAMVLLWAGWCTWFYWGDNARLALRPVYVPAMAWHMLQGDGRVESGSFVLTETGRGGEVFLFAPVTVPLAGDVIERVEVHFRQIDSFHTFAIGLSQSGELSGLRQAPAHWLDETTAVVEGRDLRMRGDPVSHVALSIRSGLDRHAVIERVVLRRQRPGFGELQLLLFDSLVDLSPWSQSSINYNRAAYVPLEVSPVPAVALWALLTGGGLLGWRLLRRQPVGSHAVTMSIVLFLAGTLLLDVGWQVSLWHHHGAALRSYGGLDAELRRREEGQNGIYAFMQDLKSELQDESRRMVIFAGSNFGYMRARYFAIPHPAVGRKGVHPAWLYRAQPGDVIVGIGTYPRLQTEPLGATSQRDTPVEPRSWIVTKVDGLDEAWAVRSRWRFLGGQGLAEIELRLLNTGGSGWVSILVERSANAPVEQWARRDVFIDGEGEWTVRLPFRVHRGAQYRIKLHADSPLRAQVDSSRLRPLRYDGDLEMLSVGDGSPHVVARRLIESSGHVAWEIQ